MGFPFANGVKAQRVEFKTTATASVINVNANNSSDNVSNAASHLVLYVDVMRTSHR